MAKVWLRPTQILISRSEYESENELKIIVIDEKEKPLESFGEQKRLGLKEMALSFERVRMLRFHQKGEMSKRF